MPIPGHADPMEGARLIRGLRGSGFVVRKQIGFQPLEKCPAQATALLEILTRRRVAGRQSYAAFLDFRKAFDMVPHSALMLKLKRARVGGRLYSFIDNVYFNFAYAPL